MQERLLSVLNIKKTESKYVFDLLAVQFFIGVANSFLNIVAITFFIYSFSISGLPYVFICLSIVLLLLNLVYEKLEHLFSPVKLLSLTIVASALILFLFWSGIALWKNQALVFLLLVWSTLFYMLTGYAYWGLVSLLFNIRESKRVFSIIGGGDLPAKLIGYLSAPLLITAIGLNNLLFLAIVSLGVGLVLLQKLVVGKRWYLKQLNNHKADHHSHKHSSHTNTNVSFFFKHKLIFTISLLSLLSYNVFNLIDYTFISQIKIKSYDIATLASFIAIFFALGRFISMILKLTFTSRVIERLGIIQCLMITPIALFAVCTVFFLYDKDSHYTLYIFGMMALLTEVLRSTIQEPVFFILFQPLQENLRLKGHIIAKGYMLAPSLFVVGISLIIMSYLNIELTIMMTVKVLLINLAIWAAIIFFIKREYIKTLRSSISRGIFSSEDIKIFDNTTIKMLLDKIENGKETEIIYSLKLLQNIQYKNLDELLEKQLYSSHKEVKKYVLSVLDEIEKVNINTLKELLDIENNIEVKEKIVSLLCKLDQHYLKAASDYMSEQDDIIRKTIIIHLLNQDEFIYLYKASIEINNLLQSTHPSERELALTIIGELKNIKFTDAIEELLADQNSLVKKHAIIAACKLKLKKLLPDIFSLLNAPSEKFMVLQGLFHYGDCLFEDINDLSEEKVKDHLHDLIKIAAKVKGSCSTNFLLSQLNDAFAPKEKIIHALWVKEYRAEAENDLHHFNSLLENYLKSGGDKIKDYNSIPVFKNYELVKNSIASEIKNDLETSLKLCFILYGKKEINRVLELIIHSESYKVFNGMEMLELVLPKKSSLQLNVLFDFTLDPDYVRKTSAEYEVDHFFERITTSDSFNPWTKAVCLYCSLKNNEYDLLKKLDRARDKRENTIMTETRKYVLNALQ